MQSPISPFPSLLGAVLMGWPHLHAIMKEREALCARSDFTEADGMRASELEAELGDLGGWEAESRAASLLAQALFGDPDILLLDEPTNGLDLESIGWLEEFLIESPSIVIVVSHDRHFLNAVCTHTCDIDFGQVRMYGGNYDFWYHANRLLAQQQRDEKKRREDKVRDFKLFIHRFSSNAAKSKQATSRKKILEKLEVDEYVASSRRLPYVGFKPNREVGDNVLRITGLTRSNEGRPWTAWT